MNKENLLIGLDKMAKHLGVNYSYMDKFKNPSMCKTNGLELQKIGNFLVIDKDVLSDWFESRAKYHDKEMIASYSNTLKVTARQRPKQKPLVIDKINIVGTKKILEFLGISLSTFDRYRARNDSFRLPVMKTEREGNQGKPPWGSNKKLLTAWLTHYKKTGNYQRGHKKKRNVVTSYDKLFFQHVVKITAKYQNREATAEALGITSRTLSTYKKKWGFARWPTFAKYCKDKMERENQEGKEW